MCKAEIESTYEGRSEDPGCPNPEFSELPVGEPTFKVIALLQGRSLRLGEQLVLSAAAQRAHRPPAERDEHEQR